MQHIVPLSLHGVLCAAGCCNQIASQTAGPFLKRADTLRRVFLLVAIKFCCSVVIHKTPVLGPALYIYMYIPMTESSFPFSAIIPGVPTEFPKCERRKAGHICPGQPLDHRSPRSAEHKSGISQYFIGGGAITAPTERFIVIY